MVHPGCGLKKGRLFSQKVAQFPSLFLGGTADLALAFAGIEAGGLELKPFDLFGGGDVDIIINGLGVLETVVEEGGDLDPPSLVLSLDFVFVANADGFGRLGGIAIVFYFAFGTGVGGFRPRLEQPDGPEIFIETELFFFGHTWAARAGVPGRRAKL